MTVKRMFALTLCLLLCTAMLTACSDVGGLVSEFSEDGKTYKEAKGLLAEGDLQGAYDLFLTIKDYRDVSEHLDKFAYRCATYSSLDETIRYTYDEYGRITQIEEDGIVWLYEYNDKGLVSRAIRGTDPESEIVFLYEYDKYGNIIKITNYDGSTSEYTYDKHGNLLERKGMSAEGEQISHTEYTYTEYGDVLTHRSWNKTFDSEYDYTYSYEYDQNGNKIRYEQENGYFEEWDYDEQGRVIRHYSEYANGDGTLRTYKYDEYGNVSEFFIEAKDVLSGTTVYKYEYDEHGNVLRQDSYRGEALTYVVVYSGYQLYYNPYGFCEIPDSMMGWP